MKKVNRNVLSAVLVDAGFLSNLLVINKNRVITRKQTIPAFSKGNALCIFAHHGGMALRPEQTQLAFNYAKQLGVDGFKTGMRLTKDQQLIVFHDATVGRTTNGSGKTNTHTLAELKKLDTAYHFEGISGLTPYRDHAHTAILTFDGLLKQYPDIYINIDLRDALGSHEGSIAPQIVPDTIAKDQVSDRVLVAGLYKGQVVRFNKIVQGSVAIDASQQEATETFLKYHLLGGRYYQLLAQMLQVPTRLKGIDLTSSCFIRWLNDMNAIPGYYGVNSINLINNSYQKGAHTIVTDRPGLAQQFKRTVPNK